MYCKCNKEKQNVKYSWWFHIWALGVLVINDIIYFYNKKYIYMAIYIILLGNHQFPNQALTL